MTTSLKEYQEFTHHTNECKGHLLTLPHIITGLVAELGELLQIYQFTTRNKLGALDDMDIRDVSSELGDVLWYISELANFYKLDLNEVLEDNKNKINKRRAARLGHIDPNSY